MGAAAGAPADGEGPRAGGPGGEGGCDAQSEIGMHEEEVRELLERHGIPTKEYGAGDALHVRDLARELREGLCTLGEEAGELVRHVTLVEVSLIACLPTSRLVLVEEEQVLDDGRRRLRPQQPRLHAKLRRGEAPAQGAFRAVDQRLSFGEGPAAAVRALPLTVVPPSSGSRGSPKEERAPAEVVEARSLSYPGLQTRYEVHRVELRMMMEDNKRQARRQASEPEYECLMGALGLPTGRSFMTVEGEMGPGRGGRVHLWRWGLAEMDKERRLSDATSEYTAEELDLYESEEEPFENSQEDMTPLEQADRDVRIVMRILECQKATLYERGGHLEWQLGFAQERLRRVLRRFSNVEALVSVNTNHLFGVKTPEQTRRLSKSLLRFLKTSFAADQLTDVVADDAEREGSPRRASAGEKEDEGTLGVLAEVASLRENGAPSSWALDCLDLHRRTGRQALLTVAEIHVVPNASCLGSSDATMRRFAAAVHAKYEESPNPFHNEAHASAVCHSTHWLAGRGRATHSRAFQVATDIAALAHDVGHFGRNNLFCISQGNALAMTYNDRSVLENMHAATCFQIMQESGCNILKNATKENRKKYRDHVVDLILATDMSTHFEFLGKMRLRACSLDFSPQDNIEDRRLLERAYLKAADLGHAALPWEMHAKWAMRLLTEFYQQGDEELALGLPVSPMCDRNGRVEEFCESQKGFLQFVIMPLFKELASVSSPEVGETCITRLEVNVEDWVKREPSVELRAIITAAQAPPKKRHGTTNNDSESASGSRKVSFKEGPSEQGEQGEQGEEA